MALSLYLKGVVLFFPSKWIKLTALQHKFVKKNVSMVRVVPSDDGRRKPLWRIRRLGWRLRQRRNFFSHMASPSDHISFNRIGGPMSALYKFNCTKWVEYDLITRNIPPFCGRLNLKIALHIAVSFGIVVILFYKTWHLWNVRYRQSFLFFPS